MKLNQYLNEEGQIEKVYSDDDFVITYGQTWSGSSRYVYKLKKASDNHLDDWHYIASSEKASFESRYKGEGDGKYKRFIRDIMKRQIVQSDKKIRSLEEQMANEKRKLDFYADKIRNYL